MPDTSFTKEIVCPFCGYVFHDSWEYNEDDGSYIDCMSCGKEFWLELDHDITYCTRDRE